MITRVSILIVLILASAVSASAPATLNQCVDRSAAKRGVLARAWTDFRRALELSKPTEAKRLADLRVDLLELVAKKKALVDTVNDVIKQASVPSWLEARVNQIPSLQSDIVRLMSRIEEEARTGGLLAADSSPRELMSVLGQKRQGTLCALSSIPVPLPKEKVSKVNALLGEIQEEIESLNDLDISLTKLIKDANEAN